jgi:alanine-synthesizing transaminase
MHSPPLVTRETLRDVRYEIRGELARRARALEANGRTLIKLNIGNLGAFGFRAPEHLQQAIAAHLPESDHYTHQQGLPLTREALSAFYKKRNMPNVTSERIFVDNGVSELIDISLRALLNVGDEVLLPSPNYPLWSAATILNDGIPRYYDCSAENNFLPNPDQIEELITPRTRALVIINPNSPTGACYPKVLLEKLVLIARKHNLLLMADEIYDGILYDDAKFEALAPLADGHPCLSFGGLSKVHRICGWRVGWMVLSDEATRIDDYHHALDLLGALRLCANVPGQYTIPTALEGISTIAELTTEKGRLYESRRVVVEACANSKHLSLVAPQGALYGFVGVTGAVSEHFNDHQFAYDLMEQESVLVVPGSSFNVPYKNYFLITLLPEADTLREVFVRIERLLERYAGENAQREVA